MAIRTGVWGIGNVERPALRAVVSHTELELAAVIVSSSTKEGQDAGVLAGLDPVGVRATRAVDQALADGLDAMVAPRAATSDRPKPWPTSNDFRRRTPVLSGERPCPLFNLSRTGSRGAPWALKIPIRYLGGGFKSPESRSLSVESHTITQRPSWRFGDPFNAFQQRADLFANSHGDVVMVGCGGSAREREELRSR